VPGESRSDPIPLNQTATAGPWQMTILEVVTGADATDRVTAASPLNEPPADGFTYVLVRVRAENTVDRPLPIDTNDFLVTGSSGIPRRFIGAFAPDPALDGVVQPAKTREGWIVIGAATDEQNLLLVYDSVSIPGRWSDCVFALQEGAAIADASQPVAAPNDAGTDAGSPAGVNVAVTTADWQVEIVEVVTGRDVFALYPESDYRTTALTIDDADDWLALRVHITNVRPGGEPAFLPPTAFMLATGDGNAYPDVTTLTPPRPDASGTYYPGASRDGWVTFEIPANYGESVVRFLPYRTDADPRYLTYAG
jgi:hypothetical protein